jgi:phage pi2 protein 07
MSKVKTKSILKIIGHPEITESLRILKETIIFYPDKVIHDINVRPIIIDVFPKDVWYGDQFKLN